MTDFTEEQLERYSRHIILDDVGVEGQIRIMEGKVLIAGLGGLGSPTALYLAAAGVGTIGLVDSDRVELSNLQRQIIHAVADLDVPKVQSAEGKIRALNPEVSIQTYHEQLRADNIGQVIEGYDFVIDGTDNFAAKFLINDACVMAKIPYSHGGVLRFNGQTMTVLPGESTCVRCVFEKPPPANVMPSCAEAGVLGAVVGVLGAIQTTEALKYLTKAGSLLSDAMLFVDMLTMAFTKQVLHRNRECALCGDDPTILELFDEDPEECEI